MLKNGAVPWLAAILVFTLLLPVLTQSEAHAEAVDPRSQPWLLMPNATCAVPSVATVSLVKEGQTQSNWCWAASARMVMRHHGVDVAQWAQANHALGRTDCEANPSSCNTTGWPDFGNYGFYYSQTSSQALSWYGIVEQIACLDRPIAFSWAWNSGGGHMQIAYGYAALGEDLYVSVHDPLPCCDGVGTSQLMLYSAYVSGSTYTHWDDFYDVRPK